MAASLASFVLFPFFVIVVAGEEACPAGASCTIVDYETNATSLQLLQIGFSMQGAGEPAPTSGSSALSLDGTDHPKQHHGNNTNQSMHSLGNNTNQSKHHRGNNTCADPGDGSARVWFICTGQKPPPPTVAEQMFGVKVAIEMCCTQEVNIDCLCCTDFAKPLDFKDCGTMQLDAAQKPPGSPGSMEQAAQDNSTVVEDSSIVVLCTMDRAMGQLKPDVSLMQAESTKIALPVQCIDRQFTPEDLSGSGGQQPGQILFDERILFLSQQGLPNKAIPTCKDTVSGTCPIGTPMAGQEPNSAGEEALSKLNGTNLNGLTITVAGFSGALMTSGSFTMMAGGGD